MYVISNAYAIVSVSTTMMIFRDKMEILEISILMLYNTTKYRNILTTYNKFHTLLAVFIPYINYHFTTNSDKLLLAGYRKGPRRLFIIS